MKTKFNLEKKTFIVIGALGLVGKEVSRHLLDQGVKVLAVDINPEGPKESEDNYHYLEGDITDLKSIESIFTYGVKNFLKIDGAINVAYPKNENFGKHFFEVTYEDFSQNLSMHLGGYFHFMQQCAKYSLDNSEKFSLVNFSSIYGVIPPKFDIYEGTSMTLPIEYAAIKSAIQHISKYLAVYTKGSKFRVNCISPGGLLDKQDPIFIEKYNAQSLSKGMLDPEDLMGTILFLCSDLSEFICGQNIIVDDGFSL